MRKASFTKSLRVCAGLTQTDVAKALKVSPAGYARFENGDATLPADKLKQLAALLHTTPERLTDTRAAASYADFVRKVWNASNGKAAQNQNYSIRR